MNAQQILNQKKKGKINLEKMIDKLRLIGCKKISYEKYLNLHYLYFIDKEGKKTELN